MGEVADMILEGLLDEETGELIDGKAPGYPRRAGDTADAKDSKRQAKIKGRRPDYVFTSPIYATIADKRRAKNHRRRERRRQAAGGSAP